MDKQTKISGLVIKDYEKLVREISELNGIIYHHKSINEAYLKQNKLRDKKTVGKFFLISHFYYRSPYDGSLIPGDFYTVGLRNYAVKAKLVGRKVANYFVALGYESFEKFLRSITARIIINNKKKAIAANERLGFSSYKSCLLHLQNQYKNNSDIIGLLRRMCDDLDTSFKKEKGLKNFLNFYRVYSKCRNHIIHSNDLIDITYLQKPEIVDEKFAIRYFGARKGRKGKYIIDSTDSYHETLKTVVSFAYLIITSFDSTFIK